MREGRARAWGGMSSRRTAHIHDDVTNGKELGGRSHTLSQKVGELVIGAHKGHNDLTTVCGTCNRSAQQASPNAKWWIYLDAEVCGGSRYIYSVSERIVLHIVGLKVCKLV